MKQTVFTFYTEIRDKYTSRLTAISGRIKRFAWYRLLVFILIFIPLFSIGFTWISAIASLAVVVLFFFLIKKNIQLEKQKLQYATLKKISEDELLALEHSFSHFENGEEFLDTNHYFSYDLDLFGDGSLFQFLNRTSTQSGRLKLAGWLKNPPFQKQEIQQRQQAVEELSKMPEWRLNFLANGKLFRETSQMSDEIKSWSSTQLTLKYSRQIKWMIIVIPLLTILAAIPAITGFTNNLLYLMLAIQWFLVFMFRKEVGYYFGYFGRKSDLFEKYVQLLHDIEEYNFQSEYLVSLRHKVTRPDSAGNVFHELKSLVKEFEYRGNIIVGLFLNSFFLWDIRCVYKLWKWHSRNHKKAEAWLEVIAETDALISLGNFANNHPGYVYPEIQEGDFTIQAENLGHPLLNPGKRVDNDFSISGWSKVMIITGANMAGKSTFLRTVGTNLVLARTGSPVCAGKMKFTPVEIYTNMRTTDSLFKDESYFFAELKRIKGVLERLENGERIFVILDEMLKGTNSMDKLNGSKQLIHKLIELKSVSLIATHDLKLSEMESEFPQQVSNKCFEIRIDNDEMVFDYKLSDGVTKTMNATFLMKKMGII